MNYTIERVRKGVRDRIGMPYWFWWYGMDPTDVGGMGPPWYKDGYNCTSLFNSICGEAAEENFKLPDGAEQYYQTAPIGGTGVWNSVVGTNSSKAYETPDSNKNYPPGSFGVTAYVSDAVQGHLQMVYTQSAIATSSMWGDQYMAQSDVSKGISGNFGYPGPHIDATMSWSFQYIDFPTWIGLVPGIPVLDGFPGYQAKAIEIVKWYMRVCKWWSDMPVEIPLLCIGAELSTVLDPARDYSIWDIPGYSTAADHDSYGQHQQRWIYYPWPWDFETNAWSFLARVDQVLGSDSYPKGTDPAAVGALVQEAQASAYPERYEKQYDWIKPLIDQAKTEIAQGGGDTGGSPIKPPPPPPPPDDGDDPTKPHPTKPASSYWFGFENLVGLKRRLESGVDEGRVEWMGAVDLPYGSWLEPVEMNGQKVLVVREALVEELPDPAKDGKVVKKALVNEEIDFEGTGEEHKVSGHITIAPKKEDS